MVFRHTGFFIACFWVVWVFAGLLQQLAENFTPYLVLLHSTFTDR